MSREKVKKTMQKMWRRQQKIPDDKLESHQINDLVDDLFDGVIAEIKTQAVDVVKCSESDKEE